MTLEELETFLGAKGLHWEERANADLKNYGTVLWAVDYRRGWPTAREYHLGTKKSILEMTSEHFQESRIYTQLGETREDVINDFVHEMIALGIPDSDDNKQYLQNRIIRLYNELRRSDW